MGKRSRQERRAAREPLRLLLCDGDLAYHGREIASMVDGGTRSHVYVPRAVAWAKARTLQGAERSLRWTDERVDEWRRLFAGFQAGDVGVRCVHALVFGETVAYHEGVAVLRSSAPDALVLGPVHFGPAMLVADHRVPLPKGKPEGWLARFLAAQAAQRPWERLKTLWARGEADGVGLQQRLKYLHPILRAALGPASI